MDHRVTALVFLSLSACAAPAVRAPLAEEAAAGVRAESVGPVGGMAAKIRALENRVRRGEAALAREELSLQVSARPNDLGARCLLAWVGAPSEDAWQALKKLSTDFPKDPWPRVGMGRIYTRWKMFDPAKVEIDKLIQLSPGFAPALAARGELLREKGEVEASKAAYEEALDAAPGDVDALTGLGLTLRKLGDDAGARAAFEKALAADAEAYEAVSALAAMLTGGADLDAAVKWQGKLVELSPRDRQAHAVLAQLKEKKKDDTGAAASYEAALALLPDAAMARSLATVYQRLGQAVEETQALETVVRLDGKDARAHMRLAELKTDDPDAAEQHLRSASDRAGEDPGIRLGLARLFAQREDFLEALENFRAAKAKGAAADGDIQAIEKKLQLSAVKGDVNKIYRQVSVRLDKLFQERLKAQDKLNGKLRIKVTIDDAGKVQTVEVVEDSVRDPVILGHVYFQLKDAEYPKGRRSPTFEFVLIAGKK